MKREQETSSRCDELTAKLQQHSEQELPQGQAHDKSDRTIEGTSVDVSSSASVASLIDQVATLTQQLDTITQQAVHRDHLLRSLEETHTITTETLRQSDLKIIELTAQKKAAEKRLASVQKETDKLSKALERTHKVLLCPFPHIRLCPFYIDLFRPLCLLR